MSTSPPKRRRVVETQRFKQAISHLTQDAEWADDALENLRRVLATPVAEEGWPVRSHPGFLSRPIRVAPNRTVRVIYHLKEDEVVLIDAWSALPPKQTDFD